MNTFTRAYLTAALWTTDPNPGQGEYRPHGQWTIANIHLGSHVKAMADCEAFQAEHAEDLARAGTPEQNGHDLWLTRNGHGAGFWSRDYDDTIAYRLSAAARALGESDLYLGDDGHLHLT